MFIIFRKFTNLNRKIRKNLRTISEFKAKIVYEKEPTLSNCIREKGKPEYLQPVTLALDGWIFVFGARNKQLSAIYGVRTQLKVCVVDI